MSIPKGASESPKVVVEKPLGGHHVRRQARAPRTEARHKARPFFPFYFYLILFWVAS